MATVSQRERISAMLEECKTNIELRYKVPQALIDLKLDMDIFHKGYNHVIRLPFDKMKLFNSSIICCIFCRLCFRNENDWDVLTEYVNSYLEGVIISPDIYYCVEDYVANFSERRYLIKVETIEGPIIWVINPWFDSDIREQRCERTRAYKRRLAANLERCQTDVDNFIIPLKAVVHERTYRALKCLKENSMDIKLFENILYGSLPSSFCCCDDCVKLLGEYADSWFQDEHFADSTMSAIETDRLINLGAEKIFYSDDDRRELDRLLFPLNLTGITIRVVEIITTCQCGSEIYIESYHTGIPEDDDYRDEQICPTCQLANFERINQ